MNQFAAGLFSKPETIALTCVLLVLTAFFLWQVAIKGLVLALRLKRTQQKIVALGSVSSTKKREELNQLFSTSQWRNLWVEYEETLHAQIDSSGAESKVIGFRATAPAEAFFNIDALVDGPLHAEFYRHLPGILTGIGIIGTFLGLIAGLVAFDPQAIEPEKLKQSLGGLFTHVHAAFVFSAIAIGLAMTFTIIEKVVYAFCVNYATGFALAIDGLFRAGVGEEYLSRLVQSSEESSTQTRQLKESLVSDLKALLTNLTEQQIAATQQLSKDLSVSIERSLEAPLSKIADVVKNASGEQSSSAASLLENLMVSFMAQMRETLGGQLGDLGGLMQQTASAVSQVEATMRGLVADMQKASEASSTGVQAAMKELLETLADHQRQQGEAASAGQNKMLSEMQSAITTIARAQEESATRALDAAQKATYSIGGAAAQAVKAGNESAEAARTLLASLQGVTTEAIQGIERGATKLNLTLGSFESVSNRMAQAGAGLMGLQEKLLLAATAVERASTTLGAGAQEVSKSMLSMGQLTARLDGVAGIMTTEAQSREAMLRDLQKIIEASREASKSFDQLSNEVQSHLTNSVERFGKSTTDVLDRSLGKFDVELSNAANLLAGSMQQLGALVSDFKTAKRN